MPSSAIAGFQGRNLFKTSVIDIHFSFLGFSRKVFFKYKTTEYMILQKPCQILKKERERNKVLFSLLTGWFSEMLDTVKYQISK